ncbi:putative nuclease HARBI1 [Heterodontus francisci]|uniref:putative nuclease HARBI1 n=1 Tax=Heterodontus francisci TaxID=7792 RepID=UPI00355C6FA5
MVTVICRILQHDLQPLGFGGNPMPVALKVTAALDFFASGSFQGSMGYRRDLSQSATHKCIKEVTNALFPHANDFIYKPVHEDSQPARSAAFGAITGFSRLQAVIDCTHVAISSPWDWPAVFVNRKGFHSLNVQLVCGHRQRIMCFPGGLSQLIYLDELSAVFEEPAKVDGWILHDKGYALCTWLMTPVCYPQSAAQERYNAAHASTRAMIEHTIGMLKMQFRCLVQSGGALRCSNILQAEEREEQQASAEEEDYDEGEEEVNNDSDAVIDMRAMERHASDIRENLIFTPFSHQ